MHKATSYFAAISTPFLEWYTDWAGCSPQDTVQRHFLSAKLDKIQINGEAVPSSNEFFFDEAFCSSNVDNHEGVEAEGRGSGDFTFTATMTVSRDMCGLE